MGNDHALEIVGMGFIKVKMNDGVSHIILEIWHVKGLKKNLLSIRQLDDIGYEFHAKKEIIKVIRCALVVMKAENITANLYMLHERTYQQVETFVANFGEELTMRWWHHKLGHMKEKGLKILSDQKLLPELKTTSLLFCEHCVISKQHRLRFSRSTKRSKSILDLVHYDVWESPVTYLGSILVLFVNDYFRRCWVYPIKRKPNVFPVFKAFKA